LTLNNGGAVTVNSAVTANQLFNAVVTLGTNRSNASFTFTNDSSSANLTFAGNVIAGSGSSTPGTKTLTLTGTGNGGISGAYVNGTTTGALTKSGSGTWTLSGTNTYSGGTVVSGGTLLVNNSSGSGTGTGTVTVSNSGTVLGGTGTISGAVTVNANAKLQGGNGTTNTTLTLSGPVTLADNSVIHLALGPSLSHSTLNRSGSNTWTFDSNQAFTFINLGATTGTYNNIITNIADPPSEGSWTITNPGFVGTFTYDGANIDLTLTAVPEPSTWAAGVLTLLALAYTQRRRLAKRPAVRI
jgi:autotransporter-associated beta strand protein